VGCVAISNEDPEFGDLLRRWLLEAIRDLTFSGFSVIYFLGCCSSGPVWSLDFLAFVGCLDGLFPWFGIPPGRVLCGIRVWADEILLVIVWAYLFLSRPFFDHMFDLFVFQFSGVLSGVFGLGGRFGWVLVGYSPRWLALLAMHQV